SDGRGRPFTAARYSATATNDRSNTMSPTMFTPGASRLEPVAWPMPATAAVLSTPTTRPMPNAAGTVQIGHGTSSERLGSGAGGGGGPAEPSWGGGTLDISAQTLG